MWLKVQRISHDVVRKPPRHHDISKYDKIVRYNLEIVNTDARKLYAFPNIYFR